MRIERSERQGVNFSVRGTLLFLWRWWPLLLVSPVLAGSVGYLVARSTPAVYEAGVSILVRTGTLTPSGAQDVQAAAPLADTFVEAVRTRPVLTAAAAQVGLTGSAAGELAGSVQVRRVPNTAIIRISAQGRDPDLAAQFVNAVAAAFISSTREAEAAPIGTTRDNLSNVIAQLRSDASARSEQIDQLRSQPASPERDVQIAQLQDELTRLQI